MKCGFAVLAVILGMFGVAGCAGSPRANALPAPIIVGQPASLDFIWVNATNTAPASPAETAELRDNILSGLRETGLFAQVDVMPPAAGSGGGIKLVATIKQITQVSKDARLWYGGLAGKARVVVRVAVSDLATGAPLEVFEVEGHTGASAWAGLTDEAIQLAAAQVVDEIKRLNARSAQDALDHERLN